MIMYDITVFAQFTHVLCVRSHVVRCMSDPKFYCISFFCLGNAHMLLGLDRAYCEF